MTLKLEYDDKKRVIVPTHNCNNRIALTPSSECYCVLGEGHKGPCWNPKKEPSIKSATIVTPIPCHCIDCKAKRVGVRRG